MTRIAALLAACLVLSAGTARAETWVQIGRHQTGGTTGRVFWDKDSLVLHDGRITLRTRIVFDQPTVAKQYGAPVRSIRSDFEINCSHLTGRHLASELYGPKGDVVFTMRGARGGTVVPPPPAVIDVCGKAKKGAP